MDFHWHVEVIPHLIQSRGFEFYVNFTQPEEAASYLREAGPPEVAGNAP